MIYEWLVNIYQTCKGCLGIYFELLFDSQTSQNDDELSSYMKLNLSNITNKSKLDVVA